MINKRLLIKNLLAHNDENSFYDKKERLNLNEKIGKAKFAKHICALANSNPNNNSFIVIGVSDIENTIIGVDFFDDSRIQNLVNAYLDYPPVVSYENIPFPHLPEDKVVGLVTIRSKGEKTCRFKKNAWKYPKRSVFYRDGSISMPAEKVRKIEDFNSKIVESIESHSVNNIRLTLDGVFQFMENHKSYQPQYKVFQDYFVLCWAGKEKKVKKETYYSRVDIELINEQNRLFYSDFDEVTITITENEFEITEFISLGYDGTHKYYPFERKSFRFTNETTYDIDTEMIFEPPYFAPSVLDFLMKKNKMLLDKLEQNIRFQNKEKRWLQELPTTYLICYLNGYLDALDELKTAKPLFKKHSEELFKLYKDTLRVVRKVRYN